MLIFPYHVDVPISRWPITNFILIVLTTYVFIQMQTGAIGFESVESYVLQRGAPQGILGHMFLHGSYLHLIGNMLFLWVFGNAVCAKVGNVAYLLIYLGLGCVAGVAHLLIQGTPAIGASGAVNGVVGMYLVFYPRNNVSCFYWILVWVGRFYLSSVWMILYWLVFDIFGAVKGAGGVAYWAHLGGFGSGFVLASALLYLGAVEMRATECSLYEWLHD